MIPITGWAADRFGTKRLYMLSLALFVLGSVLSGLAWSAESLIVFRVLQGLGGGMLMPAGMTILTRAAGPQRVGRVMGIIGVPMLLGPIFGPILGGWLVDDFSWRWIFFINIPIGVAALIALGCASCRATSPSTTSALDWLGLVLLSPGLALFIYGLAKSGSAGGFGSRPRSSARSWPASLLLVGLRRGTRCARTDPLIDLRLFKNRTSPRPRSTLVLFAISVFGGDAAAAALLPDRARRVRDGHRPAARPAGLRRDARDADRGPAHRQTGVGRIVLVGLTIVAISFLALTQLSADTSYWTLGAVLFVMGLGMGATMMPTFSGAMQTLRQAAVARASTTLNIIQQVGASIGTAVMSVLLANAISSRLGTNGGGLGAAAAVPPDQRPLVASKLADAFGSTYWWALALVVIAFAVATPLLPKQKPAPVEDPSIDEPSTPAPVLVH